MKRIILFLLTNLAIMVVLGITVSVLGLTGFIQKGQMNLVTLLGYAAVMGFGGSFISLLISKPIAKWSTGAKIIDPSESPHLAWVVESVRRHAQRAQIDMPEVAIFEGEPNAFATGATKNSALVAVSTGLLATMTREEVDAVIAHEVAHAAGGDMVTMALIQGVMNTFVVFLSRVIGWAVDQAISKKEEGEGPGIGYHITTFVLDLVLGFLGSIVVAYFSRQREYRADVGAAQLIGRPEPMINALRRLQQMQTGELPKSMAAMGISGGIGHLFSTHPPLEDRIAALQSDNKMENRFSMW